MFFSIINYIVFSKNPKDVLWMEFAQDKIYIAWKTKKSNELTLLKMDTSAYTVISSSRMSLSVDPSTLSWIQPIFYSADGKEYIKIVNDSMSHTYDMQQMKCIQKKGGKISDFPPWYIFIPSFDRAFDTLFPGLEHWSKIKKYIWMNHHSEQSSQWVEYLHFKYRVKIEQIKYSSFQHNPHHTQTLLFVDDRYRPLFPLLLRLFLYSLPHADWNFHLFCMEEDKQKYQEACVKCDFHGVVFHIMERPIQNQTNYSTLLSTYSFWNAIPEEHVLLFQYDSFVFDKMDNSFLEQLKKEIYVGAVWKNGIPYKNERLWVGNGGTSFRNSRAMEMICRHFKNKPMEMEDIFFAKRIRDLKYKECSKEMAMQFSSENIYHENCIYGHQIQMSIPMEEIERLWCLRLMDQIA